MYRGSSAGMLAHHVSKGVVPKINWLNSLLFSAYIKANNS